jgi:hypothetical protein
MNYNICTIRPPGYIHAHAFDEIECLIAAGIRDLGYSITCKPNQIEPTAKNIIIGCHLLGPESAQIVPNDSIILNTEQLSNEIGSWNQNLLFWLGRFQAWDYNQKNIEYVSKFGLRKPKLLQLGYHKNLESIDHNTNQDIDVLFYGSLNPRRQLILNELSARGIKTKILHGIYGRDRDYWISRSKIVLNLHFYQSQILEIVRCFYLMINKKAVVCEINSTTVVDPSLREAITGGPYEALVDVCVDLLSHSEKRNRAQEIAYSAIKKHPQSFIMDKLLVNETCEKNVC